MPRPIRFSQTDTVESGIESDSEISAAVIRSRLSAAIASTRSAEVLCGIRFGAEQRSKSPASPCWRKRLSQRYTVRSLTPAAMAASVTDQPCSITRSTSSRLLFGQVRALA